MRRIPFLLVLALLALVSTAPRAGAILTPEEAPAWMVSEWINGNPGALERQKGKVVVIHFFQLWCPGCNRFSVPLLERWEERWRDREDFQIVGIHSVFEGHDYQTTERLRSYVAEQGIDYPVGIDAYGKSDDEVPVTMKRYRTLGTPQIAIVDKGGYLVFSHFGVFDPGPLEFYIERLFKEKGTETPKEKADTDRKKRR